MSAAETLVHSHEPDSHNVHGNDQHGSDDHAHGDEIPHGSLREYVIGFLLSVVLTAIPFWLVMGDVLSSKVTTTILILGFAVVQMLVHMVYFLHLNSRSEGGWNMLGLIFTLVLVFIMLAGSLWVMYHMNANMMPISPHEMRNVP